MVRAPELDGVDLVYIDPPYNQHSFFGNDHVWETLVRNDRPATYGVARKRCDCPDHTSRFNRKPAIGPAFQNLVASIRADYLLVSLSIEGALRVAQIEAILRQRGHVASVVIDHKRYVGAQIGIFSPGGKKVGAVSPLHNSEHLFLVGPSRQIVDAAVAREPA